MIYEKIRDLVAKQFVVDADTLSRKVRLGAGAGIGTAFFLWPEIRDLAGRLFSGG